MKLKPGVNPFGLRPELLLALIVADDVWAECGFDLTVTSLNDGHHGQASLHYSGAGADLRTWESADGTQWSEQLKRDVAERLRDALGNNPDYDVVVEATHIHIEHQPKRRTA